MTEWVLRTFLALSCVFVIGDRAKGAGDLAEAEKDFWRAAVERDHVVLISAYLLHFQDGLFAREAADLFADKTGETWTNATAARAAWRDRIDDNAPGLADKTLVGGWDHAVVCDINSILQDIEIDGKLVLRLSSPGILTGSGSFRHGSRYSGRSTLLQARRRGSLLTYVMRAENDLTGYEVHIGVLNIEQSGGRLTTKGWEMNTSGAYCDLRGEKTS